MENFSGGVRLNDNEVAYQAALQEYGEGFVVSLKRNRQGKYTLHRATCPTLSYDLTANGKASHRTGKVIFRDHNELNAWVDADPELAIGDFNRCSRCM